MAGQGREGRPPVRGRITKHLPGGKEIGVVTDLSDEAKYPAEAMLRTYQDRWGIETVFHQITDVFSLRHLIGTMPQATLFQLSFCLLLYNALQVVRSHLASHQRCEAKAISNEKLFDDVERQLVAVDELVETDTLLSSLGPVPTAAELREVVGGLGRRMERPLVEETEFRPWRASEGEDARAWQPYVDLPRSPTSM